MIGAENIDQVIEAALAFVEVISDVGGEVGLVAILANDDAIFLITELSRREPGRAIFDIQHAAFFQHGQRGIDAAGGRQALF